MGARYRRATPRGLPGSDPRGRRARSPERCRSTPGSGGLQHCSRSATSPRSTAKSRSTPARPRVFGCPSFLWHAEFTRGTRALMSGRLEEVDRHAHRAMQHAAKTDQTLNALQFRGAQEYALRPRARGASPSSSPPCDATSPSCPDSRSGAARWRCSRPRRGGSKKRRPRSRTAFATTFPTSRRMETGWRRSRRSSRCARKRKIRRPPPPSTTC